MRKQTLFAKYGQLSFSSSLHPSNKLAVYWPHWLFFFFKGNRNGLSRVHPNEPSPWLCWMMPPPLEFPRCRVARRNPLFRQLPWNIFRKLSEYIKKLAKKVLKKKSVKQFTLVTLTDIDGTTWYVIFVLKMARKLPLDFDGNSKLFRAESSLNFNW